MQVYGEVDVELCMIKNTRKFNRKYNKNIHKIEILQRYLTNLSPSPFVMGDPKRHLTCEGHCCPPLRGSRFPWVLMTNVYCNRASVQKSPDKT
jgi:hypothetical protein